MAALDGYVDIGEHACLYLPFRGMHTSRDYTAYGRWCYYNTICAARYRKEGVSGPTFSAQMRLHRKADAARVHWARRLEEHVTIRFAAHIVQGIDTLFQRQIEAAVIGTHMQLPLPGVSQQALARH